VAGYSDCFGTYITTLAVISNATILIKSFRLDLKSRLVISWVQKNYWRIGAWEHCWMDGTCGW